MVTWIELVVYGLATFRASLLISEDDGPYNFFLNMRAWLTRKAKAEPAVRKSAVHKGVRCARCSGTWSAMVLAGLYVTGWDEIPVIQWAILVLAFGGMEILFVRVPEKK